MIQEAFVFFLVALNTGVSVQVVWKGHSREIDREVTLKREGGEKGCRKGKTGGNEGSEEED